MFRSSQYTEKVEYIPYTQEKFLMKILLIILFKIKIILYFM